MLYTGTQFWRYDNEKDQVFRQDPEGHRYPRLISQGFPGVIGPIDTAFYDRRDSHIYFFKNNLVRTELLVFFSVHDKLGGGGLKMHVGKSARVVQIRYYKIKSIIEQTKRCSSSFVTQCCGVTDCSNRCTHSTSK